MKTYRFTFCILSALALSACSNTLAGIKADTRGPGDTRPAPTTSAAWKGLKADMQDFSNWTHSKRSALEETLGPVPAGYADANGVKKESPWKLPGMEGAASAAQEFQSETPANAEAGSVWEDIGEYDLSPPDSLTKKAEETFSILINNGDVTVYSIDGHAASAVEDKEAVFSSGKMVQDIFFDYGSAKVGAEDRHELRSLAADLRIAGEYALNVVGHASPRVDHVDDPIKRKLINFEMARKRAVAVTGELRKAGVKPDSVTATSEGDAVPNPDPDGRDQEAADRRVEVYVDNK